jgi:hypothetical protein
MAIKVNPDAATVPAIDTKPIQPATEAPVSPAKAGQAAATPAPAYQPAKPVLPGKFAYAPGIRAGLFAGSQKTDGLNRVSTILGSPMAVRELFVRLEEHSEDPKRPSAHDLALWNGAMNAVG